MAKTFWNMHYKEEHLKVAAELTNEYRHACEELGVEPTFEGFATCMQTNYEKWAKEDHMAFEDED